MSSASKNAAPARDVQPSDRKKSSRTAPRESLIGKTISDKFTIVELIARGGMGKVYKAEQAPLGRICAIKILSPKYDEDEDPEFQRRFFLEASTASKLSHPNTVTIFDYGRDGDIYYIAMEYIEGRTLYRLLREEGPFDELRVAHVMRQVCRSLREAHQRDVIHRDMKPANIVLTNVGDEVDAVKVLDFGLVKDVSGKEHEDLTQEGLFMGSPKYMAPEQILGHQVSAATDIYSLGIVAYELLSGQVPFDRGNSVKTLMAHVNDPPAPMHTVNPALTISAAMEELVMRCLAKSAEDRYADTDDLIEALSVIDGVCLSRPPRSSMSPRPPISSDSRTSRADDLADALCSGPGSDANPGVCSEPELADPVSWSEGEATPEISSTHRTSRLRVIATGSDTGGTGKTVRSTKRRHFFIGLAAILVSLAVLRMWPSWAAPRAAIGQAKVMAHFVTARVDRAIATATPLPSVVVEPEAVLAIRSRPPGARVNEGRTVLCEATPCEVGWRGEATQAAHTLTLNHPDFEPVMVNVKVGQRKVVVKLSKKGSRSAAHAVSAKPRKRADVRSPLPPAGVRGSAGGKEKLPRGYKASPY